MVLELTLLALLAGWAFGGKFCRLADARIKYVWLIFVPFALQLGSWAIVKQAPKADLVWLFGPMAIAEKAALIAVAVANWKLPGVKLILAGILLNTVALCANHGMMPADPHAISAAFGSDYLEATRLAPHTRSAIMDTSTELGFLCDIVAAKRPFVIVPAVYSVGDLVMSSGIFIAIIALMRTPLPGERKRVSVETAPE